MVITMSSAVSTTYESLLKFISRSTYSEDQLPYQFAVLNALSLMEAIVVEPAMTDREPVPDDALDFMLKTNRLMVQPVNPLKVRVAL